MGPVIQMMMMSRSEEQDRIPVGAATGGGYRQGFHLTTKNDAFDFDVILRGTDSDCDISPYHL